MPQTWERKVKDEYESLSGRSPIQYPPPGGHNLFGNKIDDCIPFWLLQMDGVEYQNSGHWNKITS